MTAASGDSERGEVLVHVELRFRTRDQPPALADRIKEAVALIVGREELEEFRVRTIPLSEPKRT